MYELLIVDDQLDERALLNYLLENGPQTVNISEAANGKEALRLIKDKNFDIIITDVKMPFVNGLELAESVRKHHPTLPILFISGYDEFSFVKKALALQAVDYLLKPINPEEFQQLFQTMIEKVQQQKAEKQKKNEINVSVQKSALHHLLQGIPLAGLAVEERKSVLPLTEQITFLLVVEFLTFSQDSSMELLKLRNLPFPSLYIMTRPTQVVFFLNQVQRADALLIEEKIQNYFAEFLTIKIKTHLGKKRQPDESLYENFKTLNQVIAASFYVHQPAQTSQIGLPTDQPEKEIAVIQELSNMVFEGNIEKFQQKIQKLLADYEQSAKASPTLVRFFFTTLYTRVLENADIQIDPQKVERLLEAHYLSDIKEIFQALIALLYVQNDYLETNNNDYIKDVKRYIFNHYQEDIGLEELAQQVSLSSNYLSEIFIREEGIGLAKFIKEFRLNKARDLLLQTHQKVQEISQSVGFNNHSYFIKSFREHFGVTPDSYRKTRRKH